MRPLRSSPVRERLPRIRLCTVPQVGRKDDPTLWIADDHPSLDRPLSRLAHHDADVVLRCPLGRVGVDPGIVAADALRNVRRPLHPARVVVVACFDAERAGETGPPVPFPAHDPFPTHDSFTDRLRRRTRLLRAAQDRLLRALGGLERLACATETCGSSPKLCALLYVPDGGHLLTFDARTGRFESVAASDAPHG